MNIHFRDVQTGMVEARAVIEIEPGVYLNEVTLLNIDGQIVVEFPRKNFVGKNERTHHLDIITFENEDKQVLWELQIKQAYRSWRKENRKVLVYEDKPYEETGGEEPPRKQYRERSHDDKPRSSRPYGDRRPKEYSDRDNRPRPHDKPYGSKPAHRDKPYSERRSYDDKPRSEKSYSDRKPRDFSERDSRPRYKDKPYGDKPESHERSYNPRRSSDDKPARASSPRRDKASYDKPARERSAQTDKPKRQYKTAGSAKPRAGKPAAPKTRRSQK